ncbi:1-phosphofructokinase [Phytomonospora endophytica]|uniref:1-phosphofructokinase n=1 Tax=Phytomonospora endophytica TaxID=714109 RepID=A0A841FZ30_9ACTN|nr:1-phosphofructokinase [Phytomonospora endophytica]MBB6038782.1 1-phosphofructokinase [Phytomonospora endophytica]GIG68422.1 1-phosphofructokinase [Phytomonospora endophytica]
MIVTVTLNPSLDRAVDVERLVRGEVIRAASAHLDPGGKGVNVSRALLANGVSAPAVLPCGGDEGAQIMRLLRDEGVDVRSVPIVGRTRSNITLAEPDGTVTKINEPGPSLSPAEFELITTRALTAAVDATWVVICGSVPPGLPVSAFAGLCRRVVDSGVRLAVDTSGPALRAAAEAGADLLKPNREELAEAVGRVPATTAEVVAAARELRALGAGTVLASLGADGALLVGADGVLAGEADVPVPRSSVGAGDALLAGFLAAGAAGADAFAEALAWAAAAVSLPGSRMPGPADLRRDLVRVHHLPDGVRPPNTPAAAAPDRP